MPPPSRWAGGRLTAGLALVGVLGTLVALFMLDGSGVQESIMVGVVFFVLISIGYVIASRRLGEVQTPRPGCNARGRRSYRPEPPSLSLKLRLWDGVSRGARAPSHPASSRLCRRTCEPAPVQWNYSRPRPSGLTPRFLQREHTAHITPSGVLKEGTAVSHNDSTRGPVAAGTAEPRTLKRSLPTGR